MRDLGPGVKLSHAFPTLSRRLVPFQSTHLLPIVPSVPSLAHRLLFLVVYY